jgi:predicted peroxiredoxin
MSRHLVVKCTAGADDLERVSQALTVSAVAATSGVPVSLWLTGDSVLLAVPGYASGLDPLPHATPFGELIDTVHGLGTITVCTQCAERRGLTEADLMPGVRIAGAAAFVEECLATDSQALVY